MNAIDLQKELISRITKITDFEVLNSIRILLYFKNREAFLDISPEEEAELLQASKEAREGHFIYQSEMDKKVQEWLNEH
ncbi:MAG: hypothetical protein JW798_17670 [Prolixibacteraceae bacterium]|nr:hypothetical protein [Prolixibacteraceae bacterium]